MYSNHYSTEKGSGCGRQGQCDITSTDPDNSCKYGITGRNCIYQFVSEDTIGTDFAASQMIDSRSR